MKNFTADELEMISTIREINGDNSIDEYECLEIYNFMIG